MNAFAELQQKILGNKIGRGELKAEFIQRLLMLCSADGQLTSGLFNGGKVVISIITKTGTRIRAFGWTILDACKALAFQILCVISEHKPALKINWSERIWNNL